MSTVIEMGKLGPHQCDQGYPKQPLHRVCIWEFDELLSLILMAAIGQVTHSTKRRAQSVCLSLAVPGRRKSCPAYQGCPTSQDETTRQFELDDDLVEDDDLERVLVMK